MTNGTLVFVLLLIVSAALVGSSEGAGPHKNRNSENLGDSSALNHSDNTENFRSFSTTTTGVFNSAVNLTNSTVLSVQQLGSLDSRAQGFVATSAVMMIFGYAGWFLVYPLMLWSEHMRAPPYKLMISLGLTDIIHMTVFAASILAFAYPSNPLPRWSGIAIGKSYMALWIAFVFHLLVIALNRVVYTIFPSKKRALFEGGRVYIWIFLCWFCGVLTAILEIVNPSEVRWAAEMCMVVANPKLSGVKTRVNFILGFDIFQILVLSAMYVAVGIRVHLVSKAAQKAFNKRELALNLQQGLVAAIFLVTVATWNIFPFIHGHVSLEKCHFGYAAASLHMVNFIVNPFIYIAFNSTLRHELARALHCQKRVATVVSTVGESSNAAPRDQSRDKAATGHVVTKAKPSLVVVRHAQSTATNEVMTSVS